MTNDKGQSTIGYPRTPPDQRKVFVNVGIERMEQCVHARFFIRSYYALRLEERLDGGDRF
jgi:hypothetical protein